MKRIFKNSMREIRRRSSSEEMISPDVEIRKYFETGPGLPIMGSCLLSGSSIYWGRSSGSSFVISEPLVFPFWEFIVGREKEIPQTELEELIICYSNRSLRMLQMFTAEASGRYKTTEDSFIQSLPRDYRELSHLLRDPLVENAFRRVGISRANLNDELDFFSNYHAPAKQIMHGCFRFRNLWFDAKGELFIVAGDDLVWGAELISYAALLADLLDLCTSKMAAARRPLISIFGQVLSNLSGDQEPILNRAVYLYVLAHHAQYIHTAQCREPLSSLESATKICTLGLLASIGAN